MNDDINVALLPLNEKETNHLRIMSQAINPTARPDLDLSIASHVIILDTRTRGAKLGAGLVKSNEDIGIQIHEYFFRVIFLEGICRNMFQNFVYLSFDGTETHKHRFNSHVGMSTVVLPESTVDFLV
jgi:hypothetical protein